MDRRGQKRERTSPHRENIKALIRAGYSNQKISQITGLSVKTVYQYRDELEEEEGYLPSVCKAEKGKTPPDFGIRWTEAVNRIRRYLGKAPLSMSLEEDWTRTVNRIRKCIGKEPFPMPKEG